MDAAEIVTLEKAMAGAWGELMGVLGALDGVLQQWLEDAECDEGQAAGLVEVATVRVWRAMQAALWCVYEEDLGRPSRRYRELFRYEVAQYHEELPPGCLVALGTRDVDRLLGAALSSSRRLRARLRAEGLDTQLTTYDVDEHIVGLVVDGLEERLREHGRLGNLRVLGQRREQCEDG